MVLENLLWDWSQLGRPYLAHTEGIGPSFRFAPGDEDPVPRWLNQWRVRRDFCQCHMIGGSKHGYSASDIWFPQGHSWHRPGSLYSNVLKRHHQLVDGCRPHLHARLPDPLLTCNWNIMNAQIATRLSRVVIDVLRGNPPVVPRKDVPLPFVLQARERKVKVENMTYVKWRHRRGLEPEHSVRAMEALIKLDQLRESRIGREEMVRRKEREARR